MAAGTALVAGGSLASIGAGDEDCQCSPGVEEPASGWSSYGGNPSNGRYVSSEDGIDEPETIAWEYDKTGSIAVVDDTVYLRTDDESPEVHAIDDTNGDVRWINDEIPADGTPAVADRTVYVGGEQLTALDAADGSIRWEREFGDRSERREGSTVTSPTVLYGRVYVVVSGTIYALDPTGGSTDWKRESVTVNSPYGDRTLEVDQFSSFVVANGSVFAAAENESVVVALEPRTGDVRWRTHTPPPIQSSFDLTASETAVYADQWEGDSYRFDPETGEETMINDYGDVTVATAGEIRVSLRETAVRVERDDGGTGEWLWSLGGSLPATQDVSYAIVEETLLVNGHPYLLGIDSDYRTDRYSNACAAYDLETGDVKWQITSDEELTISGISAVSSDTIYDENGDALRALRSSKETDNNDDNDGSDGGDDSDRKDDGSDGEEDSGSDVTDDSSDDNDGSDGSDDSGGESPPHNSGGRSDEDGDSEGSDDRREDDDANGSDEGKNGGSDEAGDDEDASPGFTSIAGFTGGAVTLEWLRRRAPGGGDERERE